MAEKKVAPYEFTHAEILDNAKGLGYERYVLAGALYGAKEKLTAAEIKPLVSNFLKKKVEMIKYKNEGGAK